MKRNISSNHKEIQHHTNKAGSMGWGWGGAVPSIRNSANRKIKLNPAKMIFLFLKYFNIESLYELIDALLCASPK